jgi:hypothetical protein
MLYKVEELLALRDSVSESAVSLDKFADEEVIKGKQSFPNPDTPFAFISTPSGAFVPLLQSSSVSRGTGLRSTK